MQSEGITSQKNPTKTTTDKSASGKFFWDKYLTSIDYGNPNKYLVSGIQSSLSRQNSTEIDSQIKITGQNISALGTIFIWKQDYFKQYSAGGIYIGKMTTNRLMDEKALSGCHDHGLIFVAVLRKFGFPAIMVDTAGIQ